MDKNKAYMGLVDDVETWLILHHVKRLGIGITSDHPRVYQDELDYINTYNI